MSDRVAGLPRPFRQWLVAFALLAGLSSLWSLATPVYGAPDESAHAAKAIAVVRGELFWTEREGVDFAVTSLPDGYRFHPWVMCFAAQSERPADCGVEVGDPSGTDWFGNWVARYNPLYYATVGWPTLLVDGPPGIYAMRIVSALLASAILAIAVPLAMLGRSRWMPLGLAFLLTPMVAFFAGTISPQSTEIAGGVVVWLALLRLLERYRDGLRERDSRWLWAALTVGTVFLLCSRSLGPLWWLVIAAATVAIVGWRPFVAVLRDRAAWWWIGGIALAALFSVGWTLATGVFSGQVEEGQDVVTATVLEGVWLMIRLTPAFLEQSIGFFGWLDTPLPAFGYWAFVAAAFTLLLLAVLATARRGRWATIGTVALALVLPIVVQAATIEKTGLIWQGRYGLVFSLGAILVAAWALSTHGDRRVDFLTTRVTVIAVVLLAFTHATGFAVALYRYTVGFGATVGSMLEAPRWQPPGTWPVLLALAVLVLAAWVAVVASLARRAVAADDLRQRAELP